MSRSGADDDENSGNSNSKEWRAKGDTKDDERLFLPYEVLKEVFEKIDVDRSRTITGEEFLLALRTNKGGVCDRFDEAANALGFVSANGKGRKAFELAQKIIGKISVIDRPGITLETFVEHFRVRDDAYGVGDDRRNSTNNIDNSNNNSATEDGYQSNEDLSRVFERKRANLEELKKIKAMTVLVADAFKSVVEKKMNRIMLKEQGLKRFIPKVKNLTINNLYNNNNSDLVDSEEERRRKAILSMATMTMIGRKKTGDNKRDLRRMLRKRMTPAMKKLNDELYVNAFKLFDVFKSLNFSETGSIIINGFLHVYERNENFRNELKIARNKHNFAKHSFEDNLDRTLFEMRGRARENVDVVSFLSYFCRTNSELRPQLPKLPQFPSDGMMSPSKAPVEGPSKARREVLEARIGIQKQISKFPERDNLSVSSEVSSTRATGGIAQHLVLTPKKSPLRSAMRKNSKFSSRRKDDDNGIDDDDDDDDDDNDDDDDDDRDFASAPGSRKVINFADFDFDDKEEERIKLERYGSSVSDMSGKLDMINSVLENESGSSAYDDEQEEDEKANLRGLELEALIHVLSMKEMFKIHDH
jgi:hypothetical protein